MSAGSRLILELPEWLTALGPDIDKTYPTTENRMALVIRLADLNIRHGTGGPFGAGIFNMTTGQLIAPGVNVVLSAGCSILHAEMVAITLAQQRLGTYDLAADPNNSYELVSSTEPCAMCYGAVPWSGVRRLVCGARDEDARALGFDEGPKLADWVAPLERRGIEVVRDVKREASVEVLERYLKNGGIIYNSRITH